MDALTSSSLLLTLPPHPSTPQHGSTTACWELATTRHCSVMERREDGETACGGKVICVCVCVSDIQFRNVCKLAYCTGCEMMNRQTALVVLWRWGQSCRERAATPCSFFGIIHSMSALTEYRGKLSSSGHSFCASISLSSWKVAGCTAVQQPLPPPLYHRLLLSALHGRGV